MSLVGFILFCFATIGLTNIIVHGVILDEIKISGKSVRERLHSNDFTKKLTTCYECSGFWAGMLCGCFFLSLDWSLLFLPIYGFAGSMLGKTYTDIMFYVESKTGFELGVEDAEENR